eukprot:8068583-Pyramimonas_sp.AAC.1
MSSVLPGSRESRCFSLGVLLPWGSLPRKRSRTSSASCSGGGPPSCGSSAALHLRATASAAS